MDNSLLRYTCQMNLPGFGEKAQRRIKQSKVLVVGVGGLGCPVAQYLVSSGVGTLGLADFDIVSVKNLHRQILFTPADVGVNKAKVACLRLHQQNPEVLFMPYIEQINTDNVADIIEQYDVIVDCTDNFDTRYLLNDACVLSEKPLVYGAIYQFDGQVAVWNVDDGKGGKTPNYRDLYPEVNALQIPNCTDGGVIPTIAGIIGCIQANEVLKYITKTGELLSGKVLLFDAQTAASRCIHLGMSSKVSITQLPIIVAKSTISSSELKSAMRSDDIELIDVRSGEERAKYNIGGKHIPLSELEDNISRLDTEKKIVFYCGTGKRSDYAVELIRKKIPNAHVASLDGGLKEWMDESG